MGKTKKAEMEKKRFAVRRAKPLDFKEIAKLDKRYSRSESGFSIKEIQKFYRKNKELVLVSELNNKNNKITGFLIAEIKKSHGKKFGNIEMLFVDSRYRERGIGTALVKTLLKKFKEMKAGHVMLVNPIRNKKATALYKKLGFKMEAYHFRKKLTIKKRR